MQKSRKLSCRKPRRCKKNEKLCCRKSRRCKKAESCAVGSPDDAKMQKVMLSGVPTIQKCEKLCRLPSRQCKRMKSCTIYRSRSYLHPLLRGGRGCVRLHPLIHTLMPFTHPYPSQEGIKLPSTMNLTMFSLA